MGKAKDLGFSGNARQVLESRYLLRDERGELTEDPEGLFLRVASAISEVEGRKRAQWRDRYFALMRSRKFLPNSPTLMNAGREAGQLSACYVLPIGDSLEGIFGALRDAAKIHQSGGGTGFSFSRLRARGSRVRSTQGTASGPVSFIRIFDAATETIRQGGVRRGANMAVLRIDHPDILEFIDAKTDQRSITNFNVSVGVTDEFMHALRADEGFRLRDPQSGREVRRLQASEVFSRIVKAAWECGDPGLVFLDRINLFNPTPQAGEIESTNPCGEQPLLAFESCNLGSMNLGLYCEEGGRVNWAQLREDVRTAVHFLDAVVDANFYPVEESRRVTLRNRKIGLGVMGLADLLLEMRIPFDSGEARKVGEQVMAFLEREARRYSAELAATKGAFPNWKGSLWSQLGFPKLRNATVTTVAPTGTISLIAGASGGIEPIFAGVFQRNVLDGAQLLDVHPTVEKVISKRGVSVSELTEEALNEALGGAWSPAQKVSVEGHVRMQAAFQRHSDSAVSKTINLPESARPEDVDRAYRLAYALGCKGITIYRDKSRTSQVLEKIPPGRMEGRGEVCPQC